MTEGGEVGIGNALADFFGVDANNQTVSRTPTDLLSQQYAFNFMVRSAVESFGPQTSELPRHALIINYLQLPSKCPNPHL
jgi:hypothetical protein